MIPGFVTNPDPNLYRTGSYVTLDFETTNIEHGSALVSANRIVLACWDVVDGDGNVTRKHKWAGEYDLKELVDDINNVDFLVAQNAKFELQWLARCGYDIGSRPVYDTMVAEWVIAGNRPWAFNLDAIATRYGLGKKDNLVKIMMRSGVSPADMPRSMLLRYGYDDVANTRGIFLAQLAAVAGTRLLPVIYTRCLTTIVLSDVEANGLSLDTVRVEEEYEKTLKAFIDVENELNEITGGINMRSTVQVANYLYGDLGFEELRDSRTGECIRNKKSKAFPDGAPKVDKSTIERLNATTEEQTKFIKLKRKQGKLNAALTKTLDFFVATCRERDGLFRGELLQARTGTHRLASSGVPVKFNAFPHPKSCQFQNLPRAFKRLFNARRSGWYIGEGDGAQLEFRTGGHLGRDEQILFDIVHHVDVHQITADTLTAAGEPTSRQGAKANTFKPMYGGSKGTPAVEVYCIAFTKKYHMMHSVQKAWANTAAIYKELETEWGMKYYFPNARYLFDDYVKDQQKIFNYPIQALATAEIIPIALVHFWYRIRHARMFIINTVHDSIICEIPEDEIELFESEVVKALTTDVYQYLHRAYGMDFTIPLGVGIKVGSHWGEPSLTDEELAAHIPALEKLGENVKVKGGEISVDVHPPKVH